MLKKSVISLISYDSHLLPESIKSYYDFVDEIILGLDKDRVTWSGNPFTFDEQALWKELQLLDYDNKIKIVEESFHCSDVPIENDNYERNYLKSQCSFDWIFSFDADEICVNPTEFFVNFLPICERYYNKVDLLFSWFLPYKELGDNYAVIANNNGHFCSSDQQGFVTSKDKTFTYCRWTNSTKRILSPLAILHWSFCRTEAEVDQKINNFGHSDKTKDDPFFYNWKLVDESNYQNLVNFKTSGMGENQWEKLILIPKNELMDRAKYEAQFIL